MPVLLEALVAAVEGGRRRGGGIVLKGRSGVCQIPDRRGRSRGRGGEVGILQRKKIILFGKEKKMRSRLRSVESLEVWRN